MPELSPDTFSIVKHYEGLHDGDLKAIGLQPKLCPANVWTIGWGHAVVDPITGKQLKGEETKKRAYELFGYVTTQQADAWLEKDMAEFGKAVLALCKVSPTSYQFGALTSFAYNLGYRALEKSNLLRKFNAKDFVGAKAEFGKWVNANGAPLKGLIARRATEAEFFLSGEIVFYTVEADGKLKAI